MKKLVFALFVLLAMPFALADTWVGVDVTTTDDIYADINLNGDSDSSIFVNGDQLATQGDINQLAGEMPSLGKSENSMIDKIVVGINAVDEKDWEGNPVMLTKTGLNQFSMAIAWAMYNHYTPRREFTPLAKNVEYNNIRLTAIERLLEQKYPDDYCNIKKDLMKEYGLPYVSCVNGVGEYIKYENPAPAKPVEDTHGCVVSDGEIWCESTKKCYIPGKEYCDGLIVVNPNPVVTPPVIGGDRDSNGCLIAAGYSWNETEEKCVKEWLPMNDTERYQGEFTVEVPEEGVKVIFGDKPEGADCVLNNECVSGVCFKNTHKCAKVYVPINQA